MKKITFAALVSATTAATIAAAAATAWWFEWIYIFTPEMANNIQTQFMSLYMAYIQAAQAYQACRHGS